MQKRSLLLVGSIIGLCLSIGQIIASIVGMVMLSSKDVEQMAKDAGLDVLDSGDVANIVSAVMALVYVIFVIAIIFAIILLILNIKALKQSKVSKENFKKGLVITVVVFNFIVAVTGLYSLIVAMDIVQLLISLGFALAGIFQLVDVCKEGKRVKNALNGIDSTSNADLGNNSQRADVATAGRDKNAQGSQVDKVDKFAKAFEKLEKMKEQGAITAEEYENLRKKILEKQLLD